MSDSVLDASALLALINREPGWLRVAEAVEAGAAISTVNLAEVVSKLRDTGIPLTGIRQTLASLRLETSSFDSELAYRTGDLRADTRSLGLSLGDRACLSLAERLGLPVLTADRAWSSLSTGVRIESIR